MDVYCPSFARADRASVELRGECPRDVVDIIDAVAMARDVTRIEMVVTILRKWAGERFHEATLVGRVTRGQSVNLDGAGNAAE